MVLRAAISVPILVKTMLYHSGCMFRSHISAITTSQPIGICTNKKCWLPDRNTNNGFLLAFYYLYLGSLDFHREPIHTTSSEDGAQLAQHGVHHIADSSHPYLGIRSLYITKLHLPSRRDSVGALSQFKIEAWEEAAGTIS